MTDVERVADAFHAAVFAGDVDSALTLASPDCVLLNIPTGIGARTQPELRRYLAEDVGAHLPAGLTFRRLSRTGNRWNVADETLVSFTHDRELPWLLPGVPASHRFAEVLAISLITVQRSVITRHHTLWDYSGLLAQLHLDVAGATASV